MRYAKKKAGGISFVTTPETELCLSARPLIDVPPILMRRGIFFPSEVKPAQPVKHVCDLLLCKQLCQFAVSLHPKKRTTSFNTA